jgi:cell division protein FtsQ
MFNNLKLKFGKLVIGIAALLVGLVLLAFANDTFSSKRCKKIAINIKNGNEQLFVEQKDVENLVTLRGNDPLTGKNFDRIDLRQIEQRVLANKQIKTCQAFSDYQGNLNVEVEQFIPIARISMPDGRPDVYVSSEGAFFPLSNHFSARVAVVSGEYFRGMTNLRNKKYENVLAFLNKIHEDEFWKAQFAQIDIEADKDISIVPLVGKHILEFGEPENIENKLNKLKIFYKDILPVKGWDAYHRVSIKFADQVVCE